MSTTSHTELIGHSTASQQVVDGASNIVIMENNIINCGGDSNNKINIITSSASQVQQHHQQQQQQQHYSAMLNVNHKKTGKVSAQHSRKVSSGGGHQMIMTNATNVNNHNKEQRMYTVQASKGGKTTTTMYTTQQVYTTNVIPPQIHMSSSASKVNAMPRNVQVVSGKSATTSGGNMILCRSPSTHNNNSATSNTNVQDPQSHHHSYIQQIHESNQQPTAAYATGTTTMKTIYVNNNTGGLNLNNNNNKYSPTIVVSEQKNGAGTTKYITTQKYVQNGPSTSNNELIHVDGTSSVVTASTTTSSIQRPMAGKYTTINVQPQQTQYYYQPTTVYTTSVTDHNNKVSSSSATTTKIIGGGGKVTQQQQPQYIQIQNHRITSNVTTMNAQQQPAPVQKHRTSSTSSNSSNSSKYIIQQQQNNQAIPVSSVQQQNLRGQQTVISYSSNNSSSSSSSNTNHSDQSSVIQQSPLKMRTVLHPITEPGIEEGTRIYTVHHSNTNNHNSSGGGGESQEPSTNATTTNNENYMIVNGTKMTDEMSARILHDLSQRSSIKYNSNKQNINNGPSNNNETFVQLSHHHHHQHQQIPNNSTTQQQNVYATRQPDGTVIWNGNAPPQQQQQIHHEQYIRRTSESSNYLQPQQLEYNSNQRQSGEPHIIYQQSGNIIVERESLNNPAINNSVQQQQQQQQQQDQDEEVIGIELRPSPISITPDGKLNILQAVYQDHTYCLQTMMTPRLITNNIPNLVEPATFSTMNPNLESSTVAAAAVLSSMPGAAKLFNRQNSVPSINSMQQQQQQPQHHFPTSTTQLIVPQNHNQQRDDDANSTISNSSHPGLYIDHGEDPGEETETALEGEGEEDSETRCICELTHDDGYMICCDTCSTWQHVDCMKIDRQNIPDEYQCVKCCPREVDVIAARTLQLQKRKEQSALQLYPITSIYNEGGVQNNKLTSTGGNNMSSGGKHDKKNNLMKRKKKDLLNSEKKNRKDLSQSKNSKRSESREKGGKQKKEGKRLSKKKLKQLGLSGNTLNDSNIINSSTSGSDKLTSTLRNWIDNYEVAMTNHYSPELRARLQSVGKMQSSVMDGGMMNLPPEPKIQWMDVDGPICTTVPHAGAKILISTRNIDPNAAIIEIQGKYMLDTQQNKSNNAMLNATRKPSSGPFLFYYSVPRGNLDICVDTRTYGNEARFIRRSCRPNAEIQHKIEKNSIHLYIVARYKIMEGAEITIAHDVNVDPLTRTNSMSHTSTLCACGLVRDCKFAAALAATPPLSSPPHQPHAVAPPLFTTQNVIKRKNGTHTIGPDGNIVKEKRKYKKRKEKPPKEQKENRSRGRSTSSSAESHAGMMSPPLKNYEIHPDFIRSQITSSSSHLPTPQQLQIIPNHYQLAPETQPQQQQLDGLQRSMTPIQITSQQPQIHETIFYENVSSSASGLLKQQLDAPHQEPSPIEHPHHLQAPNHHILPNCQIYKTTTTPESSMSLTITQPPVINEIPIKIPEPTAPIQPRSVTPIQQIISSSSTATIAQKIIQSPVKSKVNNVIVSSSANPNNVMNNNKTEIIPKSPPVTPQKPSKRSSKSQRNSMSHEVSEAKTGMNEESGSTSNTGPNTPSKDHSDDKEISTTTTTSQEKRKLTREERKMEAIVKAIEKMEKTQQRKQEQKAHKSTPKKQKSLSSGMGSSTRNNNLILANNKRKLMNQKRKKRKSKSHSGNNKKNDHRAGLHSGDSSDVATSSEENIIKQSSTINSISYQTKPFLRNADLLLSEPETNLSGIPPLISPACMLVEAAVGDLEPSSNSLDGSNSNFKYPNNHQKTAKTKKALMNEWLTQSGGAENNIQYLDSPLSLVKNNNLTTPPQSSSPQQTVESNFGAGSESAVKKRWLRQAISEETNDESNSTQNEFTTPLKKRRVFIEHSEENSPNSSMDVSTTTQSNAKLIHDDASQESVHESVEVKEEKVENEVKEEDVKPVLTNVKDDEEDEKVVKVEEKVEELKKEEIVNEVQNLSKDEIKTEDEVKTVKDVDEMSHLQKVVASFHTESLMMLQTRNKKTSGTTSLPETPKKSSEDSKEIHSPSSEPESVRFTVKQSVSPDTTMQEPSSTTPSVSELLLESKNNAISTSILAQTLTSSTTPTTPVAETIPFASRFLNNSLQRSSIEVPSILATVPPAVEEYTPTSDYRTSFTYRPMMTNLTMNEYPTAESHATNVTVGPEPYIPSYNKATLIAATTPTGVTLTGQFAPAFSSSNLNTNESSNFLGKSYSTLNAATVATATATSPVTTTNTGNTGSSFYGQKIFTKTANYDPRLNPSLQEEVKPVQPPQPKKKLSLTEYRKRKAQSTDSMSNDGESTTNNQSANTSGDDTNPTKSIEIDKQENNKKLCSPNSSPLHNSSYDDTRSGNVTPVPCNNDIDDTTNTPTLTPINSGNNSPSHPSTNASHDDDNDDDDEFDSKNKMTEKNTGNSTTDN